MKQDGKMRFSCMLMTSITFLLPLTHGMVIWNIIYNMDHVLFIWIQGGKYLWDLILQNIVPFHENFDGVKLRCFEKDDIDQVLKDMHNVLVHGHFPRYTISHNILIVDYYCLTLFNDAHSHVRKWNIFQLCVRK